jgi:undecaprenyl diphosphate synthase
MKQPGLHVAIIMDGNGRWATRRGLPRVAGHRAGVASVRRVVERALDSGIARLTLYAFSSDNWRRPHEEVQSIFWLLRAFLRLEANRLRQRGVRLQAIGRRDRLPQAALKAISDAESVTAAGDKLALYVAIDYSSREQIIRAATAGGCLQERMEQSADVDLLIRTGGEQRLSDFLLWECAYAELLFTERMWPDFDEKDLDAALEAFSRRDRRFGRVSATSVELQPPLGLCETSTEAIAEA